MKLRNKRFDNIQKNILEDLYNRLVNRRERVIEEDIRLREELVKKLCDMPKEVVFVSILKGIEPLLWNKRRAILLMGGDYEEIRKETHEAIVSYMTYMPKKSV